MSYQLDLDEYSDEQIADEFARRLRLAIKGNCTYCLKLRALCGCKLKNKPGMFHTAYWTETQGLVAEYVPAPKTTPKVKLPETEFFYQIFLERSAELKKVGHHVHIDITAEYTQEVRPYFVAYDEPKKVNDAEHPPTVG